MYNQMIIFLLCMLISVTFYQEANAGKSLFLLYALKSSPRLTLFYLYLFDYSETFLPFLHTCCPANTHMDHSVESSFLNAQVTQNSVADVTKCQRNNPFRQTPWGTLETHNEIYSGDLFLIIFKFPPSVTLSPTPTSSYWGCWSTSHT